MSRVKSLVAALASGSGLSALLLHAQCARDARFIRAINYHGIPSAEAGDFEEQLDFYAQHFIPVGMRELLELRAGTWPHARPGLLLSFDDGLASHFHVAAPLLEEYGFIGWFMVPTGFVDAPVHTQVEWAREHSIGVREAPLPDGRLALSWDEIRRLSRRHVIGCHTVDHVRFRNELAPALMEQNTTEAKARLEAELGAPIEVFAWVGGEEASYCRAGAEAIRRAGFGVVLMTNSAVLRPGADLQRVQRTNVESSDSLPRLKFQLSGLVDVLYRPKRQRVERSTGLA